MKASDVLKLAKEEMGDGKLAGPFSSLSIIERRLMVPIRQAREFLHGADGDLDGAIATAEGEEK